MPYPQTIDELIASVSRHLNPVRANNQICMLARHFRISPEKMTEIVVSAAKQASRFNPILARTVKILEQML